MPFVYSSCLAILTFHELPQVKISHLLQHWWPLLPPCHNSSVLERGSESLGESRELMEWERGRGPREEFTRGHKWIHSKSMLYSSIERPYVSLCSSERKQFFAQAVPL